MTEMEAVNSFNAELQSLYEVKPPISKGKMTAVTRAALKGVKLYKHVVQSVEKFIQKCKTEYKIPGLYVIDSIIRQSRHQFGAEKDVFAPRFARNIQTTFMHLYKCPDEDKAKVIRVLNLWQKNKIFTPELIQPLFDLADPNNPIWEQLLLQQEQNAKAAGNSGMNSGGPGSSGIPSVLSNASAPFRKEILDYDYGDDDDGGEQRNQQGSSDQNYSQTQQNQNSHVGFDALGSILANPEILRQLATLQEQIAAATSQPSTGGYPTPEQERQRKMAELNKQEAAFDQRLAQTVARLPFAVDCDMPMGEDGKSPRRDGSVDQNSNQLGNHQGQPHQLLPPPFFQQINDQNQQGNHQAQQQQHQQLLNFLGQQHQDGQNPFGLPMPFPVQTVQFPQHQDLSQAMNMFSSQPPPDGMNQGFGGFNQSQGPVEIDLTDDSKDKDRRDRRRKRSRSRRSRSTSRSRIRKSRSRSRGRKRYRSRSRDRKEEKEREREKEKERVRKGFPTLKKEHLSVCSTTLWVGHLSKLVSQEELSDTFGAYGDIISIDLIAPRGCAFIVMNRRQDSMRALDRLRNTKLQGKTITLAWAPGKGMKGREWKDYWEVDSGVSYIPWAKLRSDISVDEFEDGGCVDEDTLPDFLKNRPKALDQDKEAPPLPESMEDSQDVPTPNANAPGTPQISALTNSGISASMLGSMPDSVPTSGDTDGRPELSLAVQQNSHHIPGMSNAFGMPPPVGMMPNMPMGMAMGMVPPPMLGPGMGGFPGMGGLPGMPMMANMGMMPPGLGVGPPMGGPGLLGDMPATTLANLSHLNNMQLNNSGMHLEIKQSQNERGPPEDEDKRRFSDRREGKRRSRFDDPDDRNSVSMEDMEKNSPPQSQDQSKDERPLFERLKSLAEGYGFGGNEKGPSLLGTPSGPPMGGMGPRGPMDRMPGPGPRGFPQPLLSHGPGGAPGGGPGNQFGPRGPFMGERPRVPGPQGPGLGGPRQWFEPPPNNPFLNPNPFAGNPFIQGNLTENPFEIGGPSRNDVDGSLPGPGPPGPAPLFGSPPERGGFGGHGRGGWAMDGPPGRGRGGFGRGNWRDENEAERERENRDRDRGLFGRGRGARGRDSWNREDRDRGSNDRDNRERDRGGRRDDRDEREDRDRSRGSRERDGRDRRDLRDRIREDRDRDGSFRDRRRRSTENEEGRREGRSSERQSRDKPREENWEEEDNQQDIRPVHVDSNSQNDDSQQIENENWEDDGITSQDQVNNSTFETSQSQESLNESNANEKYGGEANWDEENRLNKCNEKSEDADYSQDVNSSKYVAEEEHLPSNQREEDYEQSKEEEDMSNHQPESDEVSLKNYQQEEPQNSSNYQQDEEPQNSSNYQQDEQERSTLNHGYEERHENSSNDEQQHQDEDSVSNFTSHDGPSSNFQSRESESNLHRFEAENDTHYHNDEVPSNHHLHDNDDTPNEPMHDSDIASNFQPPHNDEFRNDKTHQSYVDNNSQSLSNNGEGEDVHEHNNYNNSESTQENNLDERFNSDAVSEQNNVFSIKNLQPPEQDIGIPHNHSEIVNEPMSQDETNSNSIEAVESNEIGNGPS